MTDYGPFAHWQQAVQRHDVQPEQPGESRLPPAFQFSQNNLQDYVDCARRFQLRYIKSMRWPAVESEPIEEYELLVEQGIEFHLLVQRHLLGIPAEALTPPSPPLSEWWEAYLRYPPPDLPVTIRQPEVQLSVPVGAYRLFARFDLLAVDPGKRAVIVDWKTTRRRPARHVLEHRLQTRVYPFVLVEAGAYLFGGPIEPEQVSLIYWFSASPADPEVFPYTTARHVDCRTFLTGLINEILARDEDIWPLTTDESRCRYCVYRSLCERGVQARRIDEETSGMVDAEFDFDIDLEQIDEIAF